MTKKKKLHGLSKRSTYKKAREFVDYDYIGKLNDAEKLWLNKFSEEFYQGKFGKEETRLNKGEHRSECYRANNARERDVWTKSDRLPNDITDYIVDEIPPSVDAKTAAEDAAGPEDAIIEAIDKDEP